MSWLSHLSHKATEPLRQLEEEVELESSAHVTILTSIQCEAAYGLSRLRSSAPELKASIIPTPLNSSLSASDLPPLGRETLFPINEVSHQQEATLADDDDSGDGRASTLAACLATPSDPPPEFREQVEVRLVIKASKNVSSRLVGGILSNTVFSNNGALVLLFISICH